MAEATVPKALVAKMKASLPGITPEVDRIRNEFQIEVDFDGKYTMKLRGNSSDLLEIAIKTLARKHNLQTQNFEEFMATIANQHVHWKISNEKAWKIANLFEKDLDQLKKSAYVSVQLNHGKEEKSKMPTSIDISCEIKYFIQGNKIVKDIKDRSDAIEPHCVKVERKVITKAKRFSLQETFDGAFCYFEESESCLKIYGIEKTKSDKVLEKWNDTLDQPKLTAPAQSPAQSQASGDTSPVSTVKHSVGKDESVPSSSVHPAVLGTSKPETASFKQSTPLMEMTQSIKEKAQLPAEVKDVNHPNEKTDVDDSVKSKDLTKPMSIASSGHFTADSSGNASDAAPKRQPGKKSRDGRYEFNSGQMKVLVYKASVTDIRDVDAIVNAANDRMLHGGGVAYYISKAAGKKMDDECNEYINKNGVLKVTENYVSKAGNMKCKGIIHAVGPQWHDYKGRQTDCAKDVYHTIVNCLDETKCRGWKNIALIAISSGIFGVPKQLCAEMYIKAIIDYGLQDPGCVKEIHFIDVNQEILDLVETAHRDWVTNPNSISYDNANNYQNTSSFTGRKTMHSKDTQVKNTERENIPSVTFVSKSQDRHHFRVAGMLDVYVYTGSVLELQDVDAIVCSMDIRFAGVLLGKLLDVAGKQALSEYQKRVKIGQAKDGEVYVFPGGNLRVKKIISIVMEDYIRGTKPADLTRLHNYYARITENAETEKITRLALPMVGCGQVKEARHCCRQLIETIIYLCQDAMNTDQRSNLKVIHLVNFEEKYTTDLLDSLRKFENRPHYEHKPQWLEPKQSEGWILHVPLKEVTAKTQVKKPEQMKKTMKTTANKLSLGNCYYVTSGCKKDGTKQLPCGHVFCQACSLTMKSGCKVCKIEGQETLKKSQLAASNKGDNCPICMEDFNDLEMLPCKHKLCKSCLMEVESRNPTCPICQAVFGIVTGNQPEGQMFYRTVPQCLPGYQSHKTIEIIFTFPDGTQKDNHPNPKLAYKGTQRRAYLPDNTEGQEVLHLFRRAFDRRLLFTVGVSRTSGKEDCVTFNDIHFKTKTHGGAAGYGYPDPDYLSRVQEELKARGIISE